MENNEIFMEKSEKSKIKINKKILNENKKIKKKKLFLTKIKIKKLK